MTDTPQSPLLQVGVVPRHHVDSAELPEWGTADDGRRVRLSGDLELQEAFSRWSGHACNHAVQFTGKTLNSIGAAVFKRYCVHCGIATTQHLPHRTVTDTEIREIDPDRREKLINQYVNERRAALDFIAKETANRQQPERRSEYSEYLSSPEWATLRNSVIERCGNLCEGCRQSSVDDVHHLTYRHIGREFLFQLVGLCRSCHTRWHEDRDLDSSGSEVTE